MTGAPLQPARRAALDDAAVAGPALLVYLATLAPSVTTGDSGELIAAAATLSIAHPTGYPLYLLVGFAWIELWGLLSLGAVPPALALNLFSALCAAGACAALRRALVRITGARLPAAAAALLLAFSLSFWSQATTARVYAPGALLTSLALLELAGLWRGRGGSLARAWLWFGLGLANHTVAVVLLRLLGLATLRSSLPWRQRLEAAYLGLACLGLYLYLPIAGSLAPAQRWGDPTSWQGFLEYFFRADYWQQTYVRDAGDVVRVVVHYLARIPAELTWPGTAVLLLGFAAGLRQRSPLPLVGLYLFAANVALMAWHGSRHDIFFWPRYLITGWLGLALVAALGFRALLAAPLPRWIGAALVAAVPAGALLLHLAQNDRSSDRYAQDFAESILRTLPSGSLLLARDDNVLFPLSYLQLALNFREDVGLRAPRRGEIDWEELEGHQAPVYFTYDLRPASARLLLVPSGLLFRLVRRGDDTGPPSWETWALPSFEAVAEPGPRRYLDRVLIARYFLMKALNLQTSDPDAALEAIHRSRAIAHDSDVAQLNAGLFLEQNLELALALECYEAALRIHPGQPVAHERRAQLRGLLTRLDASDGPEARARALASELERAGRSDLADRVRREAAALAPPDEVQSPSPGDLQRR